MDVVNLCSAYFSSHILTIEKKLLNNNVSLTSPHNMVNFGPLAAEICWRVWGTPANFNVFHVLTVLLHGTLVVGISQTLRHWTEGATYIRQGGHHVGHSSCKSWDPCPSFGKGNTTVRTMLNHLCNDISDKETNKKDTNQCSEYPGPDPPTNWAVLSPTFLPYSLTSFGL